MELVKAQWSSDNGQFRIKMPLQKVDTESRLVSGWASLDNLDLQGDIVTAEASTEAFSRFRGNIREMHQPIAVGRLVDFRQDSYYDPSTEKFYNGIYVTVYVSKGAESTWQKVLDGTLQAFSIKGPILDCDTEYVPDAGTTVRIIKSYDLEELSLVDSGGNQLANVDSVMKFERDEDGELMLKGMISKTFTENVFWCDEDRVAKTSTDDSVVCASGHSMQNIGWFESDKEDKTEKVRGIVDAYLTASVSKQEVPANNEGGVNVAEENVEVEAEVEVSEEVVAEVEETEVAEDAEVEVEVAAEVEEEAADVSEVEAVEPDFEKMFGDLKNAITSGLEKNASEAKAEIEKVSTAFEAKISELAASHGELTKNFESLKSNLEGVEKALKAVENDTAVKKSGDLGGSQEETLSKSKGSKWGGRFLGLSDLQ